MLHNDSNMNRKIYDREEKWRDENGIIKVSCKQFIGCKKITGSIECGMKLKCVDTITWSQFPLHSEFYKEYRNGDD